MLKLIEPQSHHLHRESIDSFLALLKQRHGVSFAPQILNRATFLITKGTKLFSSSEKTEGEESYGGAIIYPQKIAASLNLKPADTYEETVIKHTSAFQPKGDEYWVARSCLSLDKDSSVLPTLKAELLTNCFYIDLYTAFSDFGEKYGIDYLAYTLKISETYNTTTYKSWPCQLGISVANPGDKFVHGILSLKGKRFKARKCRKLWRKP